MRVVIDASIDPRLLEAFVGHDAQTLFDLGWQHLKDNAPVKQLECDKFVTADRGFEHQHNSQITVVRNRSCSCGSQQDRLLSTALSSTPQRDCDGQTRPGGSCFGPWRRLALLPLLPRMGNHAVGQCYRPSPMDSGFRRHGNLREWRRGRRGLMIK
jgi:hypothetical protein